MSNGESFSWLSFLLGLAIGLWISVVVLFLTDWGADDHDHCCVPGGPSDGPGQSDDGNAYVPGGSDEYYCTNDDEGGAIVVDEGGAIVVDEGGAIVVDEGGAIVVDARGRVPAPGSGSSQLNRDRMFEEFRCDTNDEGGAIVVDRGGRRVVVAMPNTFATAQCGSLNGNAVVVGGDGTSILIDGRGAEVDTRIAIEPPVKAEEPDGELPEGAPESEPKLSYCMVATPDSDPIVIRPRLGTP